VEDRQERIREIVWQHLEVVADASSPPREQLFLGLILGMRLQESDPQLAKEIFDATLASAHERVIGVVDQLSAAWRDQI
jgi:hypothetical protein